MSLEKVTMNLRTLVQVFNSSASNDIVPLLCLCESPIEQHFLYDLLNFWGKGFEYITVDNKIVGGKFVLSSSEISVIPQYHIENRRADFAIFQRFQSHENKYAVECDSWQFHSSFKQKNSDLDKQGVYLKRGWEPVSITGDDTKITGRSALLIRNKVTSFESSIKYGTL